MRSKIKAKLIVKKHAQEKVNSNPEPSVREECAALESAVISQIRGLPPKLQYMSYLAGDVRHASKVGSIEYLKILQWYVQGLCTSDQVYSLAMVEELDSQLKIMNVHERHQYFTDENMAEVYRFDENIGEYSRDYYISRRTAVRMEAEVLMFPAAAPIFEHLLKERGLRTWDAIEPLYKQASHDSLPLVEGTLSTTPPLRTGLAASPPHWL